MRLSKLASISIVLGAILSVQQHAVAAIQTGDVVKLFDSTGTGPGGQFTVKFQSGAEGFGDFDTFCVEYSETINFNTNYYVTIEPNALQGGGLLQGSLGLVAVPYDRSTFDPTKHGDPIGGDAKSGGVRWGDMTQWLYQFFALGILDDVTYGVSSYSENNTNSADALQYAIWYLQEERTQIQANNALNPTAEAIFYDLLSWANSKGSYTGRNPYDSDARYDVVAMNLWGSYSTSTGKYDKLKQSQLLLVELQRETPDDVVPEPASFAIWTLTSLAAIVAFRRRLLA
ncbi:MAG: hypothetical protein DCC68_06960 [Planctomycetota bacterium]|nr:MAG: hypothetical protein DCC68_06960 [Planctomycetota bacterium]